LEYTWIITGITRERSYTSEIAKVFILVHGTNS
jgi:hypothetical protein